MITIWKYPLKLDDEQIVEMPLYSKVIHVAEQHAKLCIWAEVDTDQKEMVEHTFRLVGTGRERPHDRVWDHLGTVVMPGGNLVVHLYEYNPPF